MTYPPNWQPPGPQPGGWPPSGPWPQGGAAGHQPPGHQTGWNQPGYGPPPSKNRKPLIITAGAAVAVLVVVGVVAALLLNGGGDGRDGSGSGGAATEVAKSYLDALSRGDAAAALALGAIQPPNTDLLNDDVLRQQLDALPISDVEVLGETDEPGASDDRTSVRVAAKLGGKRTEGAIRMVRSDGGWKLDSGFVEVSIVASVPTSTDKTLVAFGKPVGDSDKFYVFPGALEISSSSPFIDVNPVAPLSFDDLGGMEVLDAKFSMNEAGQKALKDSVLKYYQPCYGDGPKPAQCRANPPLGYDYDPATTKFTAPLNVDGLKYTFEGTLTTAMINGPIEDVPLTMQDENGRPVPLTADLHIFMQVDIGQDPPVILTK